MRKALGVCLSCLWLAGIAAAQTATVKRNVNLRADATTASGVVELLKTGATLTLLVPAEQGGFYRVKAEDGKEGWVWARNISLEKAPSSTSSATLAAAQCDTSLWNHVYNPERLIVKQQCIAVTGTIVDATNGRRRDGVRHEADGDTHGWLDGPAIQDLAQCREPQR